MNYTALKLATEPASEPVALDEAKAQTRIDGTDQDTQLEALVRVSREVVERISGRAMITQSWDLVLDAFPAGDTIELPHPPLQSVTSITYIDEDGTSATADSGDYVVDTYSEPGRIVLKRTAAWPSDTLQEAAGVRIRFVAGYGNAEDVPQRFKQAILLLVGHYFEHAEAVSEVRQLQELPLGVDALLWLDRVVRF